MFVNNKSERERRALIKTLPVGIINSWLTPAVMVVSLPAHAQTSTAPDISVELDPNLTCGSAESITSFGMTVTNNDEATVVIELIQLRTQSGAIVPTREDIYPITLTPNESFDTTIIVSVAILLCHSVPELEIEIEAHRI